MPETTRDRLRADIEHCVTEWGSNPTLHLHDSHEENGSHLMLADARRLDALVAACDNQRVRDLLEHSDVDFPECSAAYGAVLEALDAITTHDTGGLHA